ncbi:hypothetical protein K1W69_17360 [Hoeflea sp. WL0058]|uniref:Uncharacterized protein n=1 Tax=Flavimaribacter sediminis TaxID=2865987 RepID=A0AAE2ZR89_9HYPH|nr:hypothetical protein [Flavimaribacter sediminis]MBW8638968.1 hypothetical protein [Flavimaribacter sediminis]
MATERKCRECGIGKIEPGTEIDGERLWWVENDLCTRCHDYLQERLEKDASRYRHLRNRQTRATDIAAGGVFAGLIPDNKVLGGEDLDRAIDAEIGQDIPQVEPLERRLAKCLADCVDNPLLRLNGSVGMEPEGIDVLFGHFQPELSERAAALLEEAGV